MVIFLENLVWSKDKIYILNEIGQQLESCQANLTKTLLNYRTTENLHVEIKQIINYSKQIICIIWKFQIYRSIMKEAYEFIVKLLGLYQNQTLNTVIVLKRVNWTTLFNDGLKKLQQKRFCFLTGNPQQSTKSGYLPWFIQYLNLAYKVLFKLFNWFHTLYIHIYSTTYLQLIYEE